MYYISESKFPEPTGRKCAVRFTLSGHPFPSILEDFGDVVDIADIPVLPAHAILMDQVLIWSQPGRIVGKHAAKITCKSLRLAIFHHIHWDMLEHSLWRSPEILGGIKRHGMALPCSQKLWVDFGVDPGIFRLDPSLGFLESHLVALSINDEGVPDALKTLTTPSVEPPQRSPENDTLVIEVVAKAVLSVFQSLGFQCAFFGSTACQLYGHSRPSQVRYNRIIRVP